MNAELSGGRFPIHYAADMGQKEVAQYLIEKGADVNVHIILYLLDCFQKKDVHGITALLAAIWEGHVSTVAYLLSVVCLPSPITPSPHHPIANRIPQ